MRLRAKLAASIRMEYSSPPVEWVELKKLKKLVLPKKSNARWVIFAYFLDVFCIKKGSLRDTVAEIGVSTNQFVKLLGKEPVILQSAQKIRADNELGLIK